MISALSGWRWDAGWESAVPRDSAWIHLLFGVVAGKLDLPVSVGPWRVCHDQVMMISYELRQVVTIPLVFCLAAKNGLTLSGNPGIVWTWPCQITCQTSPKEKMRSRCAQLLPASYIAVTPSSGFCFRKESHCAANLLTSTSLNSGTCWIEQATGQSILTNSGSRYLATQLINCMHLRYILVLQSTNSRSLQSRSFQVLPMDCFLVASQCLASESGCWKSLGWRLVRMGMAQSIKPRKKPEQAEFKRRLVEVYVINKYLRMHFLNRWSIRINYVI